MKNHEFNQTAGKFTNSVYTSVFNKTCVISLLFVVFPFLFIKIITYFVVYFDNIFQAYYYNRIYLLADWFPNIYYVFSYNTILWKNLSVVWFFIKYVFSCNIGNFMELFSKMHSNDKSQSQPSDQIDVDSEKAETRTLGTDSLEVSMKRPRIRKISRKRNPLARINTSVTQNIPSQKKLFIIITVLFAILLLIIIFAVTMSLAVETKVITFYLLFFIGNIFYSVHLRLIRMS